MPQRAHVGKKWRIPDFHRLLFILCATCFRIDGLYAKASQQGLFDQSYSLILSLTHIFLEQSN